MADYFKESLDLHRKHKGKIEITNKIVVETKADLSRVYSPGVASPCLEIHKDPEKVYDYTIKSNTVGIVTDGSAVLGLGNIGAKAAIPVMEGKAMLFKKFAGINAFPICLDTQDADEIIETVKRIAPVFGGINLEDISAPRSFIIESSLQNLGIPVFHDDQHGTAIVTLAGLINASKVLNKELADLKVVVNGAGAAGIAIARLLHCLSMEPDVCIPVKNILICDSKGIISNNRTDLNVPKMEALKYSNPNNISGSLKDAIVNADVFIGVSAGNILNRNDIRMMAKDPVIFALANPTPEIMPEEAKAGGAAIVATGRSDYPNQVNNVLAFPGIFKGALEGRAEKISPQMKLAAAYAIADHTQHPSVDEILSSSLDEGIAVKVAQAVKDACKLTHHITH